MCGPLHYQSTLLGLNIQFEREILPPGNSTLRKSRGWRWFPDDDIQRRWKHTLYSVGMERRELISEPHCGAISFITSSPGQDTNRRRDLHRSERTWTEQNLYNKKWRWRDSLRLLSSCSFWLLQCSVGAVHGREPTPQRSCGGRLSELSWYHVLHESLGRDTWEKASIRLWLLRSYEWASLLCLVWGQNCYADGYIGSCTSISLDYDRWCAVLPERVYIYDLNTKYKYGNWDNCKVRTILIASRLYRVFFQVLMKWFALRDLTSALDIWFSKFIP